MSLDTICLWGGGVSAACVPLACVTAWENLIGHFLMKDARADGLPVGLFLHFRGLHWLWAQ